MNFVKRFIDKISRYNEPIEKWFQVTFDEIKITITANPPGRNSWQQTLEWDNLIRVIFQGEGGYSSDTLFLFSSLRPESYVIPTDAKGGQELIDKLIAKGIFNSKNFTDAVLSPYGIYCWPEDEQEK